MGPLSVCPHSKPVEGAVDGGAAADDGRCLSDG